MHVRTGILNKVPVLLEVDSWRIEVLFPFTRRSDERLLSYDSFIGTPLAFDRESFDGLTDSGRQVMYVELLRKHIDNRNVQFFLRAERVNINGDEGSIVKALIKYVGEENIPRLRQIDSEDHAGDQQDLDL